MTTTLAPAPPDRDAGSPEGPATTPPRTPHVDVDQPPTLGVVQTVAGMALAAAAALGWSGVFPDAASLVPLAGAGGAAVLVTALLTLTPLGRGARAVILLAGFVIVAAAAAERRPPTPTAVVDVVTGLRDGWAQILDSHLPVEARDGPLATAVASVWAAGCLSAVAQLARRPVLGLVPPLAALTIGLGLGAAGAAPPEASSALVVAAVATAIVAARAPGGRLRAVATAAVVVGAVAVVGTAWPGASARQPKVFHHDPPIALNDADNPLDHLGAALTDPEDPELFRASVRGDRESWVGWQVVVLDRFDGTHWTSSGTYRPVGAAVQPPEPGAPTRQVEQHVTVAELDGPFLPTISSPVEVDGRSDGGRILANATRTLATRSGGGLPTSYRAVSAVPDLAAFEDAELVPAPRSLELPPALESRFQTTIRPALEGSNPTPAGRLKALEQWFRESLRAADPDSGEGVPTGHGYHHIDVLLRDRVGTAEQFASAFAVLARSLGYDARVVVGYTQGEPDPGTDELVVTRRDAHAWPEVHFDGIGWVAYDPTPTQADEEAGNPQRPQTGAPTGAVSPTTGPTSPITGPGSDGDTPGDLRRSAEPGDPSSWMVRALLGVGVVVLLVLLVAGGIVVAKSTRRRRQEQGSPAERIAGAWSAALDRLAEGGVKVPRHLAATEVVAVPDIPAPATQPLSQLAQVANASRFSTTAATDDDATAAWRASTAVAAAVRGRRAGLRLGLSPAPWLTGLGRRSR